MIEQNFPWAMDKPLRDFFDQGEYPPTEEFVEYLLTRLKKTEMERDGLAEIVKQKRDGPGKYQRIVMDANIFIYNGFREQKPEEGR